MKPANRPQPKGYPREHWPQEHIKTAKLRPFTVSLYDLGSTDDRGQSALGYKIQKDGVTVHEDYRHSHAVFGSPMHADDSWNTLASAIHLICYSVTHDNDAPDKWVLRCDWAEELDELASMMWPDD